MHGRSSFRKILTAAAVGVLLTALAAAVLGQSPEEKEELNGIIEGSLSSGKGPETLKPMPPIPESSHPSIDELARKMTAEPERIRVAEALAHFGEWRSRIRDELVRQQMPEDLLALVFVESAFKPKARSISDAGGFWQILPATARLRGLRRDAFVDERYDPEAATRFAGRYLRDLYEQFGDWFLVMAAYNWGRGNLARAIEAGAPSDFFAMRDRGIPRPETADYVPRILAARRIMADPGKFGFDPVRFRDEKFEGLVLRPLTDATRLELLAGVPGGTIRESNPSLRTDYIPPDPGGYRVAVPQKFHDLLDAANLKENAVADWDHLRDIKRLQIKIKKKLTLYAIGIQYDTSLSSLRAWNRLEENQNPIPGDTIVLYAPDELK